MNKIKKFYLRLNKEILTYLVLSACSIAVLFAFTDIIPRVEEDFFFSSSDPQMQQEKRLSKLFKRKDSQLIICAQGDITSIEYAKRIRSLSQKIAAVPGVTSVVSITNGPNNIADAFRSPFWGRLLIADDKQATNIIVILEAVRSESAVFPIERVAKQSETQDFKVIVSGAPYIVKLIQRQLIHDFSTFSILAIVIFSFVILYIFRSWMILLGTLVCCLNATMWTFMVANLLHIQVGLLTANLATVVFVLALSPIVFLTYNWQHLPSPTSDINRVTLTIRYTIVSSFWSMATTVLGFLSLLTVPAKPLRELGISGAIGTLIAFGVAYLMYPIFLRVVPQPQGQASSIDSKERRAYNLFNKKASIIPFVLIAFGLLVLPGLWMIDKDPSLFSYFKKKSEIARGINYIDRNGGSNPLIIVVRDRSNETLNTTAAYKRLWDLQSALESHTSVGSVVSLPVLMAQAKRSPLAFFVGWEWLLSMLESPRYGEISKSFISEDRKDGLFLLRMKERGRKATRLEIVNQLTQIVQEKGFVPEMVGGTYVLQGHMSKQIASSLIYGLVNLLLIFFFINWFSSGSLKVGFAMTLSFSIIPLIVLGFIGLLKIPLDIVSAPAINVAIGMGIDSALHTVRYWRWIKTNKSDKERWNEAKRYMWNPVVNAMLVIILGFAIFLFSQFPPTQRFGAIIACGAFLSIFTSIFLMPWLAQANIMRLIKSRFLAKE
ncbi:MAG: MMPL family transporter [Candidatus Omnitrophica bacterium]|nr:MMPL family transporter [Candidatus Omnitrophota bacterium]